MIRASRRRERGRRRSSSKRRIYIASALVGAVVVLAAAWYVLVYAHGNAPGTTNPCSTSPGIVCAKLSTSLGIIEVELYNNSAPATVTNFVHLASSGFYDNLVWHRIVKGFVIQTGDPNTRNGAGDRSTWGTGGSPHTVPLEIDRSLHNTAGYLGMARSSDPNSGSSQFFINLADNSANLDGKYTVFGKVVKGMDVVLAIGNVPVDSNSAPLQNVYLISVTVQAAP